MRGCLLGLLFLLLLLLLIVSGLWPLALVLLLVVLWLKARADGTTETRVNGTTEKGEHRTGSRRQHPEMLSHTWRQFLRETRQQKNSRANVRLGSRSGFNVGIVGESFYQPELRWVTEQATNADRGRDGRVFFDAYLMADPSNPHSPNRDAVRVESSRGRVIGHLSKTDAAQYAPVFAALHAAERAAVCRAVAVGGTTRKKTIGVWISIDHHAWLAELLEESRLAPAPRSRKRRPTETPVDDQPF